MNEHTHRILSKMLALLEEYRTEKIDLEYLVKSLEGGLNALEEKLDPDFYSQWALHWGELEEILAVSKEGLIIGAEAREATLQSANELQSFLQVVLEKGAI